jgi:hypothetical protein
MKRHWLLIAGPFCLPASTAVAGMPSFVLTEVATVRLEVISFFFIGLLISAAVVRLAWNALSRDFDWLPRLSFGRALGVTVLWGLLFILVLTMISGARELMTPGAWQQVGHTYKLAEQEDAKSISTPADPNLDQRRHKLEGLGRELLRHAASHEGRYPEQEPTEAELSKAWNLPGLEGTRYVYVPGRTLSSGQIPIAYEPALYDSEPFVLLANGDVVQMRLESILELVNAER